MPSIPFLHQKLIGERFAGHKVPLEFLAELAVFEEMVIEVAKWKYLQANAGRIRSPRGFMKGVSLNLTAIGDGSALLDIDLSIAPSVNQLLFASDTEHYLEQSRNSIIAAVAAAEHQKPVTDHLPDKLLGYFKVFGRGLQDGESIEFRTTPDSDVATLTKQSRRRLLSSARDSEATEEFEIVGRIPEANQHKKTFQIQSVEGPIINAPELARYRDIILEGFNGYESGTIVRVRGVGRYSSAPTKLESIDSIDYASIVDPLDVALRINELKSLEDGWFDGEGTALSVDGLEWLSDAFETHYIERFILPHLYPTLDAKVRSEWSLSGNEISLEIDLTTHSSVWHEINLNTENEDTRTLDLNDIDHWAWMMRRIDSLGGARSD
ncbi:MAG: hypothetical protein ABI614_02605 [Planctomycetota bacterium]